MLGYFSWHQDSTYMGLTPLEKILTAWIALTPSTKESGCVCFLPKTHYKQLEHKHVPDENNKLSLCQHVSDETFIESNLPSIVYAELQPGQMSLHSSLLVHASGPNKSNYRRIGLAVRYISADVRKESTYTFKDRVTLVSGCQDEYDGFDYELAPCVDYSEAAFKEHQLSMDMERKNYFQGQGTHVYKL